MTVARMVCRRRRRRRPLSFLFLSCFRSRSLFLSRFSLLMLVETHTYSPEQQETSGVCVCMHVCDFLESSKM
jgi:hypothetical protein